MTRAQYVKRNVGSFFRRHAAVIPITIIALCIMGVFVLQALTIGQLQNTVERQNTLILQTASLSKQLVKGAAQRTSQINDVNRHLDCIVQFFAQSDRSSKAIADIDSCRISTNVAPDFAPASSDKDTKNVQKSSIKPPVAKPQSSSARNGKKSSGTNVINNVLHGISKLFGGK